PGNLPADIAISLYRVLQEATLNAVVHSAAPEISVSMRVTAVEIRLEISDHGVGFDIRRAAASGGIGLAAIRERLSIVNGGTAIESRPGGGTRVEAWVPLQRQSDGEFRSSQPI